MGLVKKNIMQKIMIPKNQDCLLYTPIIVRQMFKNICVQKLYK